MVYVRAGRYVKIDDNDDVELYYEEAGEGTTVIFIPGWTMTTKFFLKQLEYFATSKVVHAVVYDPRSQGRSTKTLSGAFYNQHARDLKRLIDILGLKDVILAGWSWGSITVYSYLDQFGTENIKGVIQIDNPPNPLTTFEGQWGEGPASLVKDFFDELAESRRESASRFIHWMFKRTLTEEEMSWMLEETLMTPDIVAQLTLYDGWMGDYQETLKKIDVPMLNIVREEQIQRATEFLSANYPRSEIQAFGNHAMFWEFPDKFNKVVEAFVKSLKRSPEMENILYNQ